MRIRRGVCYLLENETSETAYRLFLRLLPEQEAGFCISRMHPEKVRTRFGPASIRIGWLAEAPGEDHFSANADRKSTRLNSSHLGISYAVFCLKKKTVIT